MFERQPDAVERVPVHGYHVVTYSYGSGDDVLLCVNGGPGLPCDFVRDPHSQLADQGYRVVAYDQLGCGASDRPNDDSLWTLDRYRDELEIVRASLGNANVHLLGHSWGTWLGIEYALTYPDRLASLILTGGAADMPHAVSEILRLRSALGSETVAMMERHEAEGTLDHAEYRAAIDILSYRHTCRLQQWPPSLIRSIEGFNSAPFVTIQGPNDYSRFTGSIANWSRLDRLHEFTKPVLLMCGFYDLLTPECSRLMQRAFPDAQLRVFQNSAHLAFVEEPEAYFEVLSGFLDARRSK